MTEKIILSNFPSHINWDENSFIGYLHREGVWDNEKYLNIEAALYYLCKQDIASEIKWKIFKIFSIVMMSFSTHFDENDGFQC